LKKKIEAGRAYFKASKKMKGEDLRSERMNGSGDLRGEGRFGGRRGGEGGWWREIEKVESRRRVRMEREGDRSQRC